MRRPAARGRDRPAEIIAAALQLFDEKGYAATRLEDVAFRAGVSKGTIYLYFDGKEALFNAVVREGAVTVLSGWKERLTRCTGSSSDLVRDLMQDFSRMIESDQHGAVLKLVLSEAGNFPEVAHAYRSHMVEPGIDLLRDALVRGMARGEFRSVNPDVVACIILAHPMMRVIWRHSFSSGAVGVPSEQLLAAHLDLLLWGLESERRGSSPSTGPG